MESFLNQPWPYFLTAALAALMVIYIYQQPHRPGARQFIWLICVYLVWALAGGFSTLARSLPVLYDLFVLQCVCALLATALELRVVLEYTGSETWMTRRVLSLLSIPPLLLAGFAFAFPYAFARVEYRSGLAILFGQPVMKWSVFVYVAIIFTICIGILLTCLMRAPAFWAPILLLSLGAVFPVIGFAVIRPQWVSVPPIQVAILLMNVTMLTYFIALFSFRILQVLPVARDMLISRMPYGLIVLDPENRLVDFNAAAQTLPGLPGKLVVRQIASRVLGSWWDRIAPLIGTQSLSQDATLQAGDGTKIFHIISVPLLQMSGWRLGQVFLIEDVTQARQAQLRQEKIQRSLATSQERERLAREMHDSLGQSLAAAHLLTSTAKMLLEKGEMAQVEKCLDQVSDLTLAAEADVREYILGAKLTISAGQKFFEILRLYLAHFSQHYNLHVRLSIPPQLESQGMGSTVEVQLLRIIQEALTNIRKHARAQSTQVIFTDSDHYVQVAIIDDGQGFDPAAVAGQTQSFGLQSMRERVEALGGCLEITSQPGQGTQVLVQIKRDEESGEVAR